ncbi:hypothetical protein BGZ47_008876 [Haplosporangium gracile]|nr:hypothetical protein BGZ47_008876 [Haplosporangium gracile]
MKSLPADGAVHALSDSILKKLQSLSIPSLEQVRFMMNELYEKGDTPVSEAARLRKEEMVKKMIQFVKEHAELFKKKLKSVTTADSGLWSRAVQSFFKDVRLKLSWILPLLQWPRVVSDDN